MLAIVYDRYGPPEVLRAEEMKNPTPADNEVLIQVRAASVNPMDWRLMRGRPSFIRLFTGLRKPRNRRVGVDAAGEVAAVGAGVTRFKIGDAVFGACTGAFAQYACARETALALKPRNVTFELAAAAPIAALTALQGLRDKGKLKAGQRVLINGAAGGVGTFAVQMARWMGAEVTGVCSAKNAEMVRSIGAERVVDYAREDCTEGAEKYDVIFDLMANHSLRALRRVMRPHGIYVGGGGGKDVRLSEILLGMAQMKMLSVFTSRKMVGLLAKAKAADLELIGNLMEIGQVRPVIDRCYPLSEVEAAIRYSEAGHVRGKLVIVV
ncbi:MAG TPA: NAD(P)-dependent alcohol dehydrogenase [Acidobacteriaceae bacterium]|nr:NAD(P)-dependent alcohol dehydrogenase [Acidobacteriaceae bacterium]